VNQEINPDNLEYGAEVLIAEVPHLDSLCGMKEM
jgi:hypothetical protein